MSGLIVAAGDTERVDWRQTNVKLDSIEKNGILVYLGKHTMDV